MDRVTFDPFSLMACNNNISAARRGDLSRFEGFLAQKGGAIFGDGDLWDLWD